VQAGQLFTDGIENEFSGIKAFGFANGLHPFEKRFGDKSGNALVFLFVVLFVHRTIPHRWTLSSDAIRSTRFPGGMAVGAITLFKMPELRIKANI
jgi:hypothetical protein